MGPTFQQPYVKVPVQWKNSSPDLAAQGNSTSLEYYDDWWEIFEDPKLNEVEQLAIENNRNLIIAFERVEEARAQMGIAAADFYPQLTLNPVFTETSQLTRIFPGNNNQALSSSCCQINPTKINTVFRTHQLLYFLPVNLNYEADLWGKIRSQYRAAKYNFTAQEKDYEFVMLSLTSNLAIFYYQLRAIDAQLELLSDVLKTREKALKINQDRYEEKITNFSDVSLAEEEVNNVLNQYQEASRQRENLENQMALLIGLPASEFKMPFHPLSTLPPSIPEGLPSEMLLRRPDVAAAEYQLLSQHQTVKRAYSLFFPSLNFTATGGFESTLLKYFLLGISRYWSDSTQIAQMIFDGGRLKSNLDLQIAQFKEAGASYQQQILTAFQEVENALENIASYAKQYEVASDSVKWAEKTYRLYYDRYRSGVSYYINVTNTERDLLTYQINVNTLRGLQFISTIELIRALGGGWSASSNEKDDYDKSYYRNTSCNRFSLHPPG